jgi:hypothetical protein
MKSFYLCLIFIASSFMLSAQIGIQKKKSPYIGVAGALNLKVIANQNNYGYNELDYAFAPGYYGGFVFGVDVGNRFALQIEFNFANAGQSYKDVISGNENEKEVDLSYFQIPILYKRFMGQNDIYSEFDGLLENFYWLGGIQLGFLNSADVTWTTNGQEADFLSFINQHGRNPHISALQQMGAPEDDKEYFQSLDISAIFGLGYQKYLTKQLFLNVELRGGIGILDMNRKEWRFENRDGIYQASRNAFGGLRVGIGVVLN